MAIEIRRDEPNVNGYLKRLEIYCENSEKEREKDYTGLK